MVKLNKKKLNKIAFDLDETLCIRSSNTPGIDQYKSCKPIKKNIEILNKLYDEGHYILIYTARGMGIYKGDLNKIEKNLRALTVNHLNQWGVKYHKLFFGKIEYDLLIDDKAINTLNLEEFFQNPEL